MDAQQNEVDSTDEVESKPQASANGLKPGEIRITPNGNKVVVETKRWVATLAVRRFADGSLLVGDRLFPPPVDGSSAQWGRTGQGGGGGGKSGGGGGNQEASAGSWRPPYTAVGTPPELRDYRLPDEVRRRLDFTFSRGAVATPLASGKPKKKGKKKGGGPQNQDGQDKRGGRPKQKSRRGRSED